MCCQQNAQQRLRTFNGGIDMIKCVGETAETQEAILIGLIWSPIWLSALLYAQYGMVAVKYVPA